jgi:hypothetical protein
MDYLFSEKYHTYLFNLLTQSVPDSHHMVTVQQLLSADKHIWAKMAELCREGVTASSGDKPMEEALSKALADPITVSILAPLPKGTSKERSFDRSDFRQAPYKPNGGKGRGDGKNNRFGKGSSKSGKGRNGKGKGSDFVPPELKGGVFEDIQRSTYLLRVQFGKLHLCSSRRHLQQRSTCLCQMLFYGTSFSVLPGQILNH